MSGEEAHVGWCGQKVCIGSGPVRLRYTREEARGLMYDLRALLRPGGGEHLCGCRERAEPDQGGPEPDGLAGQAVRAVDDAQKTAARRARYGFWE